MKRMKKYLSGAILTWCLSAIVAAPVFAAGWEYSSAGWKYANEDGSYVRERWLESGGYWYYMDEQGYMKRGCWVQDGGKSYYLSAIGEMLVNSATPDGYWVGADGAWIPESTPAQMQSWSGKPQAYTGRIRI